jgi:hypothetical protein
MSTIPAKDRQTSEEVYQRPFADREIVNAKRPAWSMPPKGYV